MVANLVAAGCCQKLTPLGENAQFVKWAGLKKPQTTKQWLARFMQSTMLKLAGGIVRGLAVIIVTTVSRNPKEHAIKILLAIDGSADSAAAVEEVAQRPWPRQSEIKVITAAEMPLMVGMEPWVPSQEYFDQVEKAVREAAQAVIDAALEKLKTIEDKTLKISSETIQGSPREAIVEESERWGADLIVMGSRGLGAFNRLLLGSVSSAVVHHAKCSVEIVRRSQLNEHNH